MNQLGLNLKQTGLDAVEHSNLTWVETFREKAITISNVRGYVTADDVRIMVRSYGWHPDHPNAYGAIFRGKHWKCIGRKQSTYPSNHAREIRVWKWV